VAAYLATSLVFIAPLLVTLALKINSLKQLGSTRAEGRQIDAASSCWPGRTTLEGVRETPGWNQVNHQPAGRPVAGARIRTAGLVIVSFVALLYLVELVDTLAGNRFDAAGVQPREADGLDGILFAPMLHLGWAHLAANTVPLLVFGFLILLGGIARWIAVTVVVWVVGGVGVWLTGGDHTVHIGASVLAFGWLVYLLVRGLFSHSVRQVLLGLVLLFLYGGVLVGVLPGQPGVSWQGHLFGAIGGVLAAWWLGQRDRDGRTAALK
jgi:membrane associated rhomboid family serine protease